MPISKQQNIFSCKTKLSDNILPFLEANLHNDCVLVWIEENVTVQMAQELIGFSPEKCGHVRSAVLIYEGTPIAVDLLSGWRDFLLRELECEIRCFFVTGNEEKDQLTALLRQRITNLIGDEVPRERKEVGLGEWVKTTSCSRSGSSLLLTMFFDSLGELLTQMDGIKRRFSKISEITSQKQSEYLKLLNEFLCNIDSSSNKEAIRLNKMAQHAKEHIDQIPRVLLLGETGVGKTVFANYLGDHSTSVTRISIAEFVNKEDSFEYAFFGYCRGAYTSAKESGNSGLLLENIGKVLFLDEIGTATPAIQAKLLAFLDDFMVRPRGATHSLFCPLLIVAATNENIRENTRYRNDLFQRFTDIHHIPPLRDLKHNFHFIIDAMLQNPAVNMNGKIKEVGKKAFDQIQAKNYIDGNFRELNNLLRHACQRAVSFGRDYLVNEDIIKVDMSKQTSQ